ncbi:MAG: Mur ligase family protein [Eisenbergiella sp.]
MTAILNITPDHLNRHHTMENYVAVKESITKIRRRRIPVC